MPTRETRNRILALVIAALLCTPLACGCSKSEQSDTPGIAAQEITATSNPQRPSLVGPRKEIPFEHPNSPEPKSDSAPLGRDEGPREPVTEKIPGYKTPAEYFSIPSRAYSQGIVAVSLPLDYEKEPAKKYPLVIVFGGAGECARTPRQGALAWMHYYKTDEAVLALHGNRLASENLRGLATPAELGDFNRRLRRHPYKGVILACPSTPLAFSQVGPELPEIEEYVMNELIPALKSRYRVADEAIGVDGVSMGGARSMYYGLKYPEVFSSVGSVQGAFGPYLDLYRHLAKTNAKSLNKRAIQLVTSDRDAMKPSVEAMHRLLLECQIPHSYRVLTGPHDYLFNQGPGAISLLIFHNQALRRGN